MNTKTKWWLSSGVAVLSALTIGGVSQAAETTSRIEIPNVGHMKINDKDTPTNKVTVTPPTNEGEVIKKIINKKGEEVDRDTLKVGEKVTFKMGYQVPNVAKSDPKVKTLDKLVFYDDLEQPFDVDQASVKVTLGDKDITSQGKVSVDNEKEIVTWTANKPGDYASKLLNMTVDATLKQYDFSSFVKNKKIEIPNETKMIVNSKEFISNKVIVDTPIIKPSAVKTIIDKDGKEVNHLDTAIDSVVTYKMTFQVPNIAEGQKEMASLVLSDDLEQALDIQKESVSVFLDKKDVTKEGTVLVDEEKELVSWTAKTPAAFSGKKLILNVKGKVKNVDFSDWVVEGNSKNQSKASSSEESETNKESDAINESDTTLAKESESKESDNTKTKTSGEKEKNNSFLGSIKLFFGLGG